MSKAQAIAVAIAVAVPVGLLALLYVYQQYMAAGPRLRRECVSIVDTVLNEDRTVPTDELMNELKKRGVTVPTYPPDTPGYDLQRWIEQSEAREAARKAYDEKVEELRQHPEYAQAWETVLDQKRKRAVRDCIVNRARREGVRQPQ